MIALKASSLLETVIAIAIIAFCSLIGVFVFAKITNQVPAIDKYEISYQVDALIKKTIDTKDINPTRLKFENFEIEKKINQKLNNENLFKVDFLVYHKKDTLTYSVLLFKNEVNEN